MDQGGDFGNRFFMRLHMVSCILCLFLPFTICSASLFFRAYQRHIPLQTPLYKVLEASCGQVALGNAAYPMVSCAESAAGIRYNTAKRSLAVLYKEYVEEIDPVVVDAGRYGLYCERFKDEFSMVAVGSTYLVELNSYMAMVVMKMVSLPAECTKKAYEMALHIYDLMLAVADAYQQGDDPLHIDDITFFLYACQSRVKSALIFQQTGHLEEISEYQKVEFTWKMPYRLDEREVFRKARMAAARPFTGDRLSADILRHIACKSPSADTIKTVIKSLHNCMQMIGKSKSIMECLDWFISDRYKPNTRDRQLDLLLEMHCFHVILGGVTRAELHLGIAVYHIFLFKVDRMRAWGKYLNILTQLQPPHNNYPISTNVMRQSIVCPKPINIAQLDGKALPAAVTTDYGFSSAPFYMIFSKVIQEGASGYKRAKMMAALCAMDSAAVVGDDTLFQDASKDLQAANHGHVYRCTLEIATAYKSFKDAMRTKFRQYVFAVKPTTNNLSSMAALEFATVIFWMAHQKERVFPEAFAYFKAVIAAFYKHGMIPDVCDFGLKMYLFFSKDRVSLKQ